MILKLPRANIICVVTLHMPSIETSQTCSMVMAGFFLCAVSARVDNQKSWWVVDLNKVYNLDVKDIFGRTSYGRK